MSSKSGPGLSSSVTTRITLRQSPEHVSITRSAEEGLLRSSPRQRTVLVSARCSSSTAFLLRSR